MTTGQLSRPAVFLNRIETAVPPNDGHQKFLSFLPHFVKDQRLVKIIGRLASKCQIEHRYSVLTPGEREDQLDGEGFFVPGAFASTARRMERYKAEALPLAARAVSPLLEDMNRESITHLIVTSCTGFYAPGLDLELQRRFNLRADIERSIIGFMGCYAAFNGMKSAYHIVRSNPAAKVLMVNLELCSLHLQESEAGETEAERVLGFLQFADGCAASLISSEPVGLELKRFHNEVISDDVELIQWHVIDTGFEMVLSPEVPLALGRSIPAVAPRIMTAEERARMKLWAIHPGGRSILDAVQEKLEIRENEMSYSRDVLRDYGNMSSATIMFVLKRILEDVSARGLGSAMAFGPGLTVESMIFDKA